MYSNILRLIHCSPLHGTRRAGFIIPKTGGLLTYAPTEHERQKDQGRYNHDIALRTFPSQISPSLPWSGRLDDRIPCISQTSQWQLESPVFARLDTWLHVSNMGYDRISEMTSLIGKLGVTKVTYKGRTNFILPIFPRSSTVDSIMLWSPALRPTWRYTFNTSIFVLFKNP